MEWRVLPVHSFTAVNESLWFHNERDGFLNHRRLDYLFNPLPRHRSKKTSKLRVTGLCEGNPPVAGGFPSQRTSNTENASIWWRHHSIKNSKTVEYRYKQRVLMHGHQGWNVRHGLCHIYMIYVYIWVVHSFCLFCCLFIIVTTQFVALYEPCKPKPKPKPSTYDTRTTTPWQRSKFRYLDRSQSNKYAINMQIQTISVSK